MGFKIGDKVKIKSKYGSITKLEKSLIYNQMLEANKSFVYIVNIEESDRYSYSPNKVYTLNNKRKSNTGDFYYECDMEPYLRYERKEKLEKIFKLQNDNR